MFTRHIARQTRRRNNLFHYGFQPYPNNLNPRQGQYYRRHDQDNDQQDHADEPVNYQQFIRPINYGLSNQQIREYGGYNAHGPAQEDPNRDPDYEEQGELYDPQIDAYTRTGVPFLDERRRRQDNDDTTHEQDGDGGHEQAQEDTSALLTFASQMQAEINQDIDRNGQPGKGQGPLSPASQALRNAELAHIIYALDSQKRDKKEQPDKVEMPDDARLIGLHTDTETGLGVGIIRDEKLGYILVFRGSRGAPNPLNGDPFKQDWLANNGAQAIGHLSPQYRQAAALANAMKGYVDGCTGHSLGGGLCQAASAASGLPSVTFQAAGLHIANLIELGSSMEAMQEKVTNYRSTPDIVNLANLYGPAMMHNAGEGLIERVFPVAGPLINLFSPMSYLIGEPDSIEPKARNHNLQYDYTGEFGAGINPARHHDMNTVKQMLHDPRNIESINAGDAPR